MIDIPRRPPKTTIIYTGGVAPPQYVVNDEEVSAYEYAKHVTALLTARDVAM